MSKLTELQDQLDRKAGITIKESSHNSSTREILDIKLKLEYIQNGINEVKGLPTSSPLLKESLQQILNGQAGVEDIKKFKEETSDRGYLLDSIQGLKTRAGVRSGDIVSNRAQKEIKESLQSELDDRTDTVESLQTYGTKARCKQCGWTGDLIVNRGEFISNAKCPECGVGPGVLIRESKADLDIQESVVIDLCESSFKNNTFTFTLSEGDPDDLVGSKIYVNRPTASEKKSRPERDLKNWVATISEAIVSKGKLIVKAFIHDEKIQELLDNPVSRKAMGIVMDSGNLCFVTENGQGIS